MIDLEVTHFRSDPFSRVAFFRSDLYSKDAHFRSDLFSKVARFRSDLFSRWDIFQVTFLVTYFFELSFNLNVFNVNKNFRSDPFSKVADFRSDLFFKDAYFRSDRFRDKTFSEWLFFWMKYFPNDLSNGLFSKWSLPVWILMFLM